MSYWKLTFCSVALLVLLLSVAACSRTDTASHGAADRTGTPEQAAAQREREEYATRMEQRISEMERRLAEMKASTTKRNISDARLESIQDVLKELRAEVADLRKPASDDWWPATERYVERDARRLESQIADRRTGSPARTDTTPAAGSEAKAPATGQDFARRRDQFVQKMQAQIDFLEHDLNKAASTARRKLDVDNLRAKLKDLRDEVNELRNVTAENWWESTKSRVDRTLKRMEKSLDSEADREPKSPK